MEVVGCEADEARISRFYKWERFKKEHTKISEEQYAEIKRKEFYCFGNTAKELGFVDEIV
ncbi:MAG: hypothetical protein AB7E09_08290 [Candidatus Izemoplasmatales bacterium]